jgi:hypothetical protein
MSQFANAHMYMLECSGLVYRYVYILYCVWPSRDASVQKVPGWMTPESTSERTRVNSGIMAA